MNQPLALFVVVLSFCSFMPNAQAENAFRPGELWPDDNGVHINAHGGGVLYHDGAYYWFGEHKVAGRRGNSAQVGVHVYSSTDLYNWKDEGIALPVVDEQGHDIERGSVIERPKVIYNEKTKKFVMWFHLELKGQGYAAARTALAVADKPTGPYTYIRSLRPHAGVWPSNVGKAKQGPTSDEGMERWSNEWEQTAARGRILRRDFEGGQMSRDMTLFVDDDGRAYHITASEENRTLHISLLTDDYLDFTDQYVRVFPGGANEAPAICKHEGKYYMITSGLTGWAPNPARSAVADSIMGPWKSLGNPAEGVNPTNNLGPEKTFGAQSTFILPVQGKDGAFIAMFDEWRPRNPIDGRYVWLPVEFVDGRIVVRYRERWDLSVFDEPTSAAPSKY